MLMDDYDAIQGREYRVMDDEGRISLGGWTQRLPDDRAVKALQDMLYARTADRMAVSYQRQGRMYTYPLNYGQEAIAVAAGMVMRRDDWLVPAFRELAAWLAKGATMKDVFLYFRGNEDASRFPGAQNMLPISVPIASQIPHAVGIGFAVAHKKEDKVIFTFVGEGGTSQGDFHEGLNFAGVWKVPLVCIIQNNQFAISVPVAGQPASTSFAIKAVAYGIRGIRVDGNDFWAMHDVLEEAAQYARSGNGPVLVEAVTFRKGAHTTSDDPSKYRTKEEEEAWEVRDPVRRLRLYLESKGLWNEEQEKTLIEEFEKDIDRQFREAEAYGPYKLEDVFRHMYADMPQDLEEQKLEYEKFLRWKEART